jgi:hypothetical protein
MAAGTRAPRNRQTCASLSAVITTKVYRVLAHGVNRPIRLTPMRARMQEHSESAEPGNRLEFI